MHLGNMLREASDEETHEEIKLYLSLAAYFFEDGHTQAVRAKQWVAKVKTQRTGLDLAV